MIMAECIAFDSPYGTTTGGPGELRMR